LPFLEMDGDLFPLLIFLQEIVQSAVKLEMRRAHTVIIFPA